MVQIFSRCCLSLPLTAPQPPLAKPLLGLSKTAVEMFLLPNPVIKIRCHRGLWEERSSGFTADHVLKGNGRGCVTGRRPPKFQLKRQKHPFLAWGSLSSSLLYTPGGHTGFLPLPFQGVKGRGLVRDAGGFWNVHLI